MLKSPIINISVMPLIGKGRNLCCRFWFCNGEIWDFSRRHLHTNIYPRVSGNVHWHPLNQINVAGFFIQFISFFEKFNSQCAVLCLFSIDNTKLSVKLAKKAVIPAPPYVALLYFSSIFIVSPSGLPVGCAVEI